MFNFIKNLLFIPKCKCCGRLAHENNLCNDCRRLLAECAVEKGKALTDKNTGLADGFYGAYYYKGAAKAAVLRAKFKNPASFLNSFAADCAEDIKRLVEEKDIDIITYVPFHKSKLYTKEYDLPREMAKRLGKALDIPIKSCAEKTEKSAPQHTLTLEQRKVNLVNAFKVTEQVQGKSILIIDDVITTGSTMTRLAREFKLAGADKVYCWSYTYNTH